MDPLLLSSATELAAAVRRREVTARAVVDAHIARIEAVNPAINAVVADRFAAARAEADAADARVRAEPPDQLPPLLGVPCTIKESFSLEGMPNSAGLVARRGVVAERDATAVARLRRAGAIPLGVTNTSELCMWMETSNRLYGRTNNPYDRRRTVGGSSGGEGAVVGAGGVPFGLGADVGGSIRMPAFFNGVFGHKCSGGLIPNTGQHPLAEGETASRYLSTGPIARRAADLWPIIRVLAGPDGEDPGCRELPLGDPAAVDLRALRVLDVQDDGRRPVCPELRGAQRRAAAALAARGATVEQASFADFRHAFDIWSAMLALANPHTFRELLFVDNPGSKARYALARWAAGRGPYTLPSLTLAAAEKLTAAFPARVRRFAELGARLREEVYGRLGEGVMLYPSHPTPAPRHYVPLSRPFNWTYTALLNVLELPVTQAPLGLDRKGLPLGVQIAAAPGGDHRTVAAALALEADFGGWVPPRL